MHRLCCLPPQKNFVEKKFQICLGKVGAGVNVRINSQHAGEPYLSGKL